MASVGGMFGAGFYLAEDFSKSNQYIPCPMCKRNAIFTQGACDCQYVEPALDASGDKLEYCARSTPNNLHSDTECLSYTRVKPST